MERFVRFRGGIARRIVSRRLNARRSGEEKNIRNLRHFNFMSRNKRPDEEYEIESLTKGLIVLEALEGVRWEPVTAMTVMERTGFTRDLVDRTLKTLRLKGYAVCEKGKWRAGKRFIRLGYTVAKNAL